MAVIPLPFELKKFCKISTLMGRWECSEDLVRELVSKGKLKAWHPEGKEQARGLRIEVKSVLDVEAKGYVACCLVMEDDT